MSEPKLRVYRIVRSYAPHLNRSPQTIKTGLTLEEARAHCKRPDTRKAGCWFDGYDYMRGIKEAS